MKRGTDQPIVNLGRMEKKKKEKNGKGTREQSRLVPLKEQSEKLGHKYRMPEQRSLKRGGS